MTDLDELRKRVEEWPESKETWPKGATSTLIRDLWRWGLEQMHNADYWAGLALHGYEPVTAEELAEASSEIDLGLATFVIDQIGPLYRQRKP